MKKWGARYTFCKGDQQCNDSRHQYDGDQGYWLLAVVAIAKVIKIPVNEPVGIRQLFTLFYSVFAIYTIPLASEQSGLLGWNVMANKWWMMMTDDEWWWTHLEEKDVCEVMRWCTTQNVQYSTLVLYTLQYKMYKM